MPVNGFIINKAGIYLYKKAKTQHTHMLDKTNIGYTIILN